MNEWQPIETAPKGIMNEVLTCRGGGLMAVAVNIAGAWCVSDGCAIVGVTHWMPLPKPPKLPDVTNHGTGQAVHNG